MELSGTKATVAPHHGDWSQRTIKYNTIHFCSNNKHSNGCNSRDNIYIFFSDIKICLKGIHKMLK